MKLFNRLFVGKTKKRGNKMSRLEEARAKAQEALDLCDKALAAKDRTPPRTKFAVGDELYTLTCDGVEKVVVESIEVHSDSSKGCGWCVYYSVSPFMVKRAKQLFRTKQALIDSL